MLLGSSDTVSDIKMAFIHNLCTPRKLSMPHGHLIRDIMRPDRRVQHEAKVNPKLINKTFRLEPKNHQAPVASGYEMNISAKEFLERQREEVRKLKERRMALNESINRSTNGSIASMMKTAVNEEQPIEIKTSKLLNVIEHDKYVHLQRMIDESDFKSRMKIKKKDWFINPEHSIAARQILCLKKSLGYSQNILRERLQPFVSPRALSGD
jgi:hypothetical protein